MWCYLPGFDDNCMSADKIYQLEVNDKILIHYQEIFDSLKKKQTFAKIFMCFVYLLDIHLYKKHRKRRNIYSPRLYR